MERTRPQYVFEAEPYGGAVTRGLERDDYGVLPSLTSDAGAYRLLVTNEVNETQMTNLFELWALWGSHMIRALLELRGTAVNDWYTEIDRNPAAADSIRACAVWEDCMGCCCRWKSPAAGSCAASCLAAAPSSPRSGSSRWT